MQGVDAVGKCETFKNWDGVGEAVTALSNETSGGTSGEKRKGCGVHQTEG